MDFAFEFVSGSDLRLKFGSHLLIFMCNPAIVVACLYLGIFSEQEEVQLEAAEKYTFVFLPQLQLLLNLHPQRVCIYTQSLVPVLVLILYLRILVPRLLLCLMGLPRLLLSSDRALRSRGTVEFLAIFVQANGYP